MWLARLTQQVSILSRRPPRSLTRTDCAAISSDSKTTALFIAGRSSDWFGESTTESEVTVRACKKLVCKFIAHLLLTAAYINNYRAISHLICAYLGVNILKEAHPIEAPYCVLNYPHRTIATRTSLLHRENGRSVQTRPQPASNAHRGTGNDRRLLAGREDVHSEHQRVQRSQP